MKFNLLLVSIVLFLTACGSDKRVVVAQKQELPPWYISAPKSSSTDLYSVGEGQTKKDAIADALSMMVSTLSVSISSSFNSKTVVKEGLRSSNEAVYTSEIQSDVKKIRISNYELINYKNIGYKKYIVLVKSNKKLLFNSMQKELEQKFYLINKQEKALKNQNTIKQMNGYREFKEYLADVPDTLVVMNVLDENFSGNKYLEKYELINRKYKRLFSDLSFSVNSNSTANNLKSAIHNGLNMEKLRVSKSKGKNHFNIYVKSSIQKANSYGFTLARSSIDITVKDYKGVIIGSNKLNIVGQSSQGYAIAKENIAFKLNKMIKKDGISKVIGLKI